MGDLHAYEQLLVWLLAFGPFAVLFVVVYVVRRRDVVEDDEVAPTVDAQGAGPGDDVEAPVSG